MIIAKILTKNTWVLEMLLVEIILIQQFNDNVKKQLSNFGI